MRLRRSDWLLIVVSLTGGVLAWQSGRDGRRLSQEHARLVRMTGDLPITDPTQVHVQALETGEPLHFAWRVYFPPNYKQIMTCRVHSGNSSWSSWSSNPMEFIGRVRFRENKDGLLEVYTRFGGGSSLMSFGDKGLAELLRGRWDKIGVEQLGAPRAIALAPDRSAVFLRLTLPEELREEARRKLPPHSHEQYIPTIFELNLGRKPTLP